jgi:hypothetical protein
VLASIRSATLLGIAGQPVHVEVHVSNGLPVFPNVYIPAGRRSGHESCRRRTRRGAELDAVSE